MHAPDHVLNTAVSVTTAVVAAGGVGYAVHRARRIAEPPRMALAAVTTGFIFSAQLVDFPVLQGTSGHLMGAALATALLGPWLAILSVALVLVIQSLVFADGGVTALGTNVVLMALVGVAAASLAITLLQAGKGARLPRRAATAGAALSVPASAAAFSGLYALGGTHPVPLGDLFLSMVGVHALIGVGEAIITVGVLSLVLSLSPGLAAVDDRPFDTSKPRAGVTGVGCAAAAVAVVLSTAAATSPDGLETVALAYRFADAPAAHAFAGAYLADYGAASNLPVSLAGAAGAVLTTGLAGLLVLLLGGGAKAPVELRT